MGFLQILHVASSLRPRTQTDRGPHSITRKEKDKKAVNNAKGWFLVP